MRDDGSISRTLCFDGNAICYAPYRGKRYFIDLSSGSFDDYLAKFSAKTRNTLKRKARRFAEYSGGVLDFRYYTSPGEMLEFCQHAISVSRVSYQAKIGFGFPETAEFKTSLIGEAGKGRACGFVLMSDSRPVSYVFCRINGDHISYAIPGYDPKLAKFSPGTVLLFLILQRLFAERRFRVFDFGGQEWGYKELFGTSSVDYVRVFWFPVTMKNFVLVTAHCVVRQAWRGVAWVKGVSISCAGGARAVIDRCVRARRDPMA
jgi:hypothetical protein